ncbi:hypothetical protein BDBG_17127 [Blastomyces gilchristii SLH14081]|uniref:Uncharacterized protein n=1 Tax=Blastomyces gilchristii (strain SLH14081) TaxID=559298 RepID=A0A179UPC0_BLAGS|nr:uncharacterized protein BDBG_17127 [Blastomyces gilchristii SLH14081]OAT08871.1 hypothetical protein BDBG_17127 [Blastomyces gilchristii SLH14081]
MFDVRRLLELYQRGRWIRARYVSIRMRGGKYNYI